MFIVGCMIALNAVKARLFIVISFFMNCKSWMIYLAITMVLDWEM